MTIARSRAALGPLAALMLAPVMPAGVADAQTAPQEPPPASTPPQTIPGLDNYSLPPSQPTPAAPPVAVPAPTLSVPPVVTPSPTPSPSPTRVRPAPVAAPRAAPSPRPTAPVAPNVAPSPSPTPSPVAPSPAPVATPSPEVRPEPTPRVQGFPYWPWLAAAIGAAALMLGAGRLLRRHRRSAGELLEEPQEETPPENISEGFPSRRASRTPAEAGPFALPPPVGPAPRLLIGLRPLRAGLNLLTATAECEIAIANAGDAPAEAIRLDVALVSAHAGQDADIAAVMARPIGRPAVPPFTLAPGEERRVRAVGTSPREAIRLLVAGGAPLFVPIAAVRLVYQANGAEERVSAAFAIGIERPGAAKLAPFRLDQPPRLYDQVAARRHMSLADG